LHRVHGKDLATNSANFRVNSWNSWPAVMPWIAARISASLPRSSADLFVVPAEFGRISRLSGGRLAGSRSLRLVCAYGCLSRTRQDHHECGRQHQPDPDRCRFHHRHAPRSAVIAALFPLVHDVDRPGRAQDFIGLVGRQCEGDRLRRGRGTLRLPGRGTRRGRCVRERRV